MKIGVFSDSLAKLSRRQMFAWCAERGITDVELGVGAWGPWPRPHLDLATIGERKERDRLAGELKEHGLRLAAVNGAGNLLHPDPAKRKDAQTRFRAAVDLAVDFGVKRVVTMSGCPAGPGGGGLGIFPCWATSADDERLFDWQMEHEVGPFWRQTSDWLAKEAPEVMVCLEMHAGLTVFNAAGFEVLTGYVGRNIGLNMDPSHFWWQGIDPLTRGRGLRRPHRLDAWQGHAALSRPHPPAWGPALRPAQRSLEGALAFRAGGRGPRRRGLDGPDQCRAQGGLRRRDLHRARGSAL